MIEAAAYCEWHQVEDMRRALHREYCDQRLRKVTASEEGGKRDSFGGTYESIATNHELLKRYFDVTKPKEINGKKKRNTRIHPHSPQIKELVEFKKTRNRNTESEMRVLKPGYKLEQPRYIFEPSVQISESLSRQTSKKRDLFESVHISDRVNAVVTHANPKKAPKRPKRISSV
jgi:hypothetical protein